MIDVALTPLFLVGIWSVPVAAVTLGLVQVARGSRDRRSSMVASGVAVVAVPLLFTGIVLLADHGPLIGPALPITIVWSGVLFARGRRDRRPMKSGTAAVGGLLALGISLRPVMDTTWSPGQLTVLLRGSVVVWEIAGLILFVIGVDRARRVGWRGWLPYSPDVRTAGMLGVGAALLLLAPAFGAAVSHIGA